VYGIVPSGRLFGGPWRWIFKLCFVAVCAWFGRQYVDHARYCFSPSRPPLQLGDVTSLEPGDIPHNGYVCVAGISEHRGLSQTVSRALGQQAEVYWYFRLVGSRGVFVEVPADAEHYGITQRMQVCGRAIDPMQSALYQQLFSSYAQQFATEINPPVRLVQQGVVPGTGRNRYIVAMLLIGSAAVAQLASAARLLGRRQSTRLRQQDPRF
jgi:hypothetical protein